MKKKEKEAKYVLINIETQSHTSYLAGAADFQTKTPSFYSRKYTLSAMLMSHLTTVHSSFAAFIRLHFQQIFDCQGFYEALMRRSHRKQKVTYCLCSLAPTV